MEIHICPLRQLQPDELTKIAALHYDVLPSLLSDLGLPFIRRYYEIAHNDPSVVGFYALLDDELVGWAIGSPQPARLISRLGQQLVEFAGQLFHLVLTRPQLLWPSLHSVFSISGNFDLHPGEVELTYIGVSLAARGQGVGRALLEAFVEASRAAGYRSVVLSVLTDNDQAVALYTKAGFKVTRTFVEGRFERHRMELAF